MTPKFTAAVPPLASCPRGPRLKQGPYKGERSGHHWICAAPGGRTGVAKCKRCGATERLANSYVTDNWRGASRKGVAQRAGAAGATPEAIKQRVAARKKGNRYG